MGKMNSPPVSMLGLGLIVLVAYVDLMRFRERNTHLKMDSQEASPGPESH